MKASSTYNKLFFDYMCVVVWAHGLPYLSEIMSNLEADKDWEIIMVKRISDFDPSTFVMQVYSCDTYPLEHIKNKIKYLLKLSTEATFIFLKCYNPKKKFVGTGFFRSIQSQKMVLFKRYFRDKYNPRDENGEITHDHVLHGTDYEAQTDYLLKLIGYPEGLKIFERETPIPVPYHIKWTGMYRLKNIHISKLRANILYTSNGKANKKLCNIVDTPHFLGIADPSVYETYLNKFQYTYLCDFYSPKKFLNLQHDDIYEILKKYPIIVKECKELYVILDGIHRASVAKHSGILKVPAVILK